MTAFINEHRGRFGVEPICSTLGVSASAYYRRATGWRSARVPRDERLLDAIRELHEANYFAYGSRRMWKALLRDGWQVGRSRVERLMLPDAIHGRYKRRGKPWRTTTSDPRGLRHPDLVNRDFTAAGPDRLWLADFTYLRCHEGVVFFSFVIDAFSRMIVGWQSPPTCAPTLVVLDALRSALDDARSRRRRRARAPQRCRAGHLVRLQPGARRLLTSGSRSIDRRLAMSLHDCDDGDLRCHRVGLTLAYD